jgi:collagen type I alpha
VNGATIVQETVSDVVYYHVELPEHDIIQAEGLSCESYLNTGNRSAFENGGGAVMLHPDFSPLWREARTCAELVSHGPRLDRIRATLSAEVAGVTSGRVLAG